MLTPLHKRISLECESVDLADEMWKFVEKICLILLNENELKEVEFFPDFFNMVHSVEWNGEDVMN